MAILPSIVRSNPNTVAVGVGLTVAAIDVFIFEETNPLMTAAKAVGGAAITRGLIHLDTTTHTVEIGKSKVVIAEVGDDKFAFSGVLNMKDLDGLDLNTVQQQFTGKVAPKAS
jgi:fumarylacetoacetate (FAA) hydrolase family protein